MQVVWKKAKHIVLLLAVFTAVLAPGIYPGSVHAATCEPDVLGGVEEPGNLKVEVRSGNIGLYQYGDSEFVPQYHMEGCGSGIKRPNG